MTEDFQIRYRPGRGEWEIIKGRSAHLGWIRCRNWEYYVEWDPQRLQYHDIRIDPTNNHRELADRVLAALRDKAGHSVR